MVEVTSNRFHAFWDICFIVWFHRFSKIQFLLKKKSLNKVRKRRMFTKFKRKTSFLTQLSSAWIRPGQADRTQRCSFHTDVNTPREIKKAAVFRCATYCTLIKPCSSKVTSINYISQALKRHNGLRNAARSCSSYWTIYLSLEQGWPTFWSESATEKSQSWGGRIPEIHLLL